ncbi:probable CoA ligase CCL5 isoform X2 [Cryptomeria japonica]|nr:probable CoA ligase CCL5 isoform X2 [Cryptomeria japonica]
MGKEVIAGGLPCSRDLRSGFCKENGVYYSKHKPRSIPDEPYLDVVSYVLSPKHRAAEIALIDSSTNQQISYKELPGKIRCVAAGLYRMGIRQGDVVCIVSPNSIHFPVIFLGILSIGAVATTTNPLNTAAEIIKQTRDSKAKLAFAVPELVERVKPTGLPLVVITQESYKHAAHHFITYGELLQSDPCMAPTVKIRQEDTAALLYSSGTTGVSKGVIITHRNVISMVTLLLGVIISESNLNAWEMVSLAVLPMFHVYGLTMLVAGMLAVGATCVVMGRFELEEMLRTFEHYKITFVPLVPPIILALTHHSAVVGKYDLTSVRHVGSGAAPLGKQVAQAFANRFPHIQLLQGYGMTETIGATSVTTGEGYKRYGSAGLLIPNIEAKVIDVDKATPLPPNQKGELCLRGPIIMKGYFSNEEATSSTIDKEGWLHTGDLCYFDEDGFLYVVDRLKELIKYNAYQVAPAELEALLLSHPEILDGAVVP